MEAITAEVTGFLAAHEAVAPFVVVLLSAAETTAFLSFLVPSTALLLGVGAGVAAGAVSFLPVWVGAAVGALAGSSLSWWLGRHFGERILRLRPLRRRPELVAKARAFFARRGAPAVFLGHFVGPVRPLVFLLAGMSGMSFPRFLAFNAGGALAWAYIVPKTGEIGGDLAGWLSQSPIF